MAIYPTLEARSDIKMEGIRPRPSAYTDITVSLSGLLPTNTTFRFAESLWTLRFYNRPLLLSDLGWTHLQAAATHSRFAAFEEDWSVPGMEEYDAL
jgi:hypothetical protein